MWTAIVQKRLQKWQNHQQKNKRTECTQCVERTSKDKKKNPEKRWKVYAIRF